MPDRFEPPPYPYDRLDALKAQASAVDGGLVDLSIGTPCDPMPPVVVWAMAESSDSGIGYPPSIGTIGLRDAACGWMERRLGVRVAAVAVLLDRGRRDLLRDQHHRPVHQPGNDRGAAERGGWIYTC